MTAETTEWAGPARFLPPPEPVRRDDGVRHHVGATYAAPGGYRPLQLDLWVPDSATPPPLVVWIHGGGWMMGDRRYLPETLRPNQVFDELVHGTTDWLVPYAQSEQLHAALTAAGVACRLVPVEGAEHVFTGCDDVDAVVRLSVDHLAKALLP
jgi:acetyl esterase/lipase